MHCSVHRVNRQTRVVRHVSVTELHVSSAVSFEDAHAVRLVHGENAVLLLVELRAFLREVRELRRPLRHAIHDDGKVTGLARGLGVVLVKLLPLGLRRV